jgi:hypothetical protein
MRGPDISGAIERSDCFDRYFVRLARQAVTVGKTFPTADEACCRRFVESLAWHFKAEECSTDTLGRVLARALGTC